LIDVLSKGVVVVPYTATWRGPWLGATRRPSLQRAANRPIICHVLDALRQAGVAEVAVVAPSDAALEIGACLESEAPAGVTVRLLVADSSGDGDDALALAAEFVGDDPCVLHRANGLLEQVLLPHLELVGDEAIDALLLVDGGDTDGPPLRLVPRLSLDDATVEATPATPGYAGVCVLGAGALARAASMGPPNPVKLHDFADLAQRLASDGGHTRVRVVRSWRHFTDNALDLLAMNRMLLDALDPETTASSYDGNRFEGTVVIHPTASVTSSVIVGPAIIGAETLVADSYIGPHTSIGERVRIEGVELERSIVLADASLLHVGGRLVASVVGRNARVFRDFSVPRALRLQVGDGDEVALC
jgi:glucose-1-phosphate thymidylyltransferase